MRIACLYGRKLKLIKYLKDKNRQNTILVNIRVIMRMKIEIKWLKLVRVHLNGNLSDKINHIENWIVSNGYKNIHII